MSVGTFAPNRLMSYHAALAGGQAAAASAPGALAAAMPAFLAPAPSALSLSPAAIAPSAPAALAPGAAPSVVWLPVPASPLGAWPTASVAPAWPAAPAQPAMPAAPALPVLPGASALPVAPALPAAPLPLPAPVAPSGPLWAQGPAPAWWGGQVGQALQQVSQQAWCYLQGLLQGPAPSPVPPSQPSPQQPGPQAPTGQGKASFVMSSFNILGSSHTEKGGKRPQMASGPERMNGVLQIMREQKIEVVGFQEMQKDQAEAFMRRVGSEYALYPGVQKGKLPTHNSMAWRKDTFAMVSATTMDVPYFNGKPAKQPVVRLRHKQTGQEFYVINVHNPAFAEYEKYRDRAEALEVAMIKKLQAQTGLPVFIVGDMNEREDAYRSFVGQGGMRSSDQGAKGQAPKKMNIDWIFGTKDVAFSQHKRIAGGLVDRTTDHPVIVSRATIG